MPADVPRISGEGDVDRPHGHDIIGRFRGYDELISTQIQSYFTGRGRPITQDYIEGLIVGGCSGALLGAVAVLTWCRIL